MSDATVAWIVPSAEPLTGYRFELLQVDGTWASIAAGPTRKIDPVSVYETTIQGVGPGHLIRVAYRTEGGEWSAPSRQIALRAGAEPTPVPEPTLALVLVVGVLALMLAAINRRGER